MARSGKSGFSRRGFLEMAGRVGGSAAVYEAMVTFGLINTPGAWAGPPKLDRHAGEGQRVLVLGAGIGGLATALMLDQAGYRCEVLEVNSRAGGRNLTARPGTRIHQEGHRDQICQFDKGLYLNMGPGRLPYHHRRILHYCRELNVPLEVYVMETTANLFQTQKAFDGRPQVNRRVANDTRGYIAELLAKAVYKGSLDDELQGDELEEMKNQLLCMLKVFGDLGKNEGCDQAEQSEPCLSCSSGCADCDQSCGQCWDCVQDALDCFKYTGSTRSGCARPLGVDQTCIPPKPLALSELLRSEFWTDRFYQPVEYEWQPTLFQPVGGMDRIVDGFVRRVGHLIDYQSVVKKVEISDDGVAVSYIDHMTGDLVRKTADFCVSNIPLPILAKQVKANFTDDYGQAVQQAEFGAAAKVGWQANARFWEDDAYGIYGGISWIDDLITQMWYPSNDYFSEKGTLTGAYIYDDDAERFGRWGLERRLREAKKGALKLHPEFGSNQIVPTEKGLSIAWQQVPFAAGGWPDWNDDDPEDAKAYHRLLGSDRGRFFVVGDQVSPLPGWQEGALMSAEHVVELITELKDEADLEKVHRAPSTRRLVQGRF